MGTRKDRDKVNITQIRSWEEWEKMKEREGGITLVDVYSEWAGPCNAMINSLKRIKVEIDKENTLHFAVAMADKIPVLDVFMAHCIPTWLFIAAGEVVAVMHGANAPLLTKMVEEEIEKEKRCIAGELERTILHMEDCIPVSDLLVDEESEPEEEPEEEDEDTPEEGEPEPMLPLSARILLVQKVLVKESDKYDLLISHLEESGFEILDSSECIIEEQDIADIPNVMPETVEDFTNMNACVFLLKLKSKESRKMDQYQIQKEFEKFFTTKGNASEGSLAEILPYKDGVGFFCLDQQGSINFVSKMFQTEMEDGKYKSVNPESLLIFFNKEKFEESLKESLQEIEELEIIGEKELAIDEEIIEKLDTDDTTASLIGTSVVAVHVEINPQNVEQLKELENLYVNDNPSEETISFIFEDVEE